MGCDVDGLAMDRVEAGPQPLRPWLFSSRWADGGQNAGRAEEAPKRFGPSLTKPSPASPATRPGRPAADWIDPEDGKQCGPYSPAFAQCSPRPPSIPLVDVPS